MRERQENNFRSVDQLLGLWKSLDENNGVLVRVRRAVTGEFKAMNGTATLTLFADLVKFERLEGMNDIESFPKTLKMHLPNRDTYLQRIQVKFGRSKSGVIRSVVLRGRLVRNGTETVWGSDGSKWNISRYK